MPDVGLMRFQKLDCYIAAKDLARLVHEAGITHSVLRDQACRASVSCFLQLAEGLPNEGMGMRRKYFTESNNFLHETVAALDLAQIVGAIDGAAAADIQELALRLKRMLRASFCAAASARQRAAGIKRPTSDENRKGVPD